mmetsp:Transcript_11792/g.19912  ORF Transcript_11792/g.19912 Transcript_11792/m.19912 type:complete len:115 (+) Transcript_11792:1532-1876(+)
MLADGLMRGGPLPQVIIESLSYDGDAGARRELVVRKLLDSGCYERAARRVLHVVSPTHLRRRDILRVKPLKHCVERVIKRGYYKENRSLGPAMDFELAFLGYRESPLHALMNRE